MTGARDHLIGLGVFDRALAALLTRLHCGVLRVTFPNGRVARYEGRRNGPEAAIDLQGCAGRRILTGGSIGFAEAYMEGLWDSPDLDALLDLGLANLEAWDNVDAKTPFRPLTRIYHALHDNHVRGARRNVQHHYDLGNDFYRLWLDETMSYSAGCFGGDAALGLEHAQQRKWERILELLQPGPRDRLLEIGCGWGSFATYAARESGCRVTGLTLSEEQAAHARRMVEEQGLEDKVEIRLRDYRLEDGTYDSIASIEMFEAVGERWWPTFFGKVRDFLKPGGAAALQVITIAEERFEQYRSTPDFTQRYIFPGGMLPSQERFAHAAKDAGLAVGSPHFFGKDYAITLSEWRRRFEGVLPEVQALGFDERFVRMWRYYLAYCRAGFDSGNINVMQVRLDNRGSW